MSLLQEINEHANEEIETIDVFKALNEAALAVAQRPSRGGRVNKVIGGAVDFLKKHPGVAIGAAALAIDSYAKYKRSQRNTIRLFARDAYEKKMMTDIIKILEKGGKYKVIKTKYADGGRIWILRRQKGFGAY